MKKLLFIIPIVLVGLLYLKFFFSRTTLFSATVKDITAIEVQQRGGLISLETSDDQNINGSTNYKGSQPLLSTNQRLIINGAQSNIEKTEIKLPKDVNIPVTAVVGSGNIEILFRDSMITQATVSAGASNMHLVLPNRVSSEFTISVGAGNIYLDVPKGVKGLRFVTPQGSSFAVDNQNYTLVNGGYQSKGFNNAQIKSTIHLSAGSSNLSIKEVE